jgi:hypothetical protein
MSQIEDEKPLLDKFKQYLKKNDYPAEECDYIVKFDDLSNGHLIFSCLNKM